MSFSLTLEELRALLGLLYSQPTQLNSSLQTAASKLQTSWPTEIPLGLETSPPLLNHKGIRPDMQENYGGSLTDGNQEPASLLTPFASSLNQRDFRIVRATQAQTPTLQQSDGTAEPANPSCLTIRIPARRPQSPSFSREELIENSDVQPPVRHPGSRNAVPRRQRQKASPRRCRRGAVRPAPSAAGTKRVVLPGHDSKVVDEEDEGIMGEEDEGIMDESICSAADAQAVNRTHHSLQFLASCSPVPEIQALPPKVRKFLLTLGTACDAVLASKEANKATRLIDALRGYDIFVEKISSATTEDSLEILATRCSAADQDVAMSDFVYMLRTIHLRVRVMQEVKLKLKSRNEVIDSIRCHKLERSSLWRYFHDGGKFALLAGGGTILLLIILASAKLRSRLRDRELQEDVLLRLVYLLRCPTQDEAGQCVRTSIIPAIAAFRERHRLTFSSLFSPSLTINHLDKGLKDHDISSDLDVSDSFFNSMTLRAILKPRCKISWASCYSALSALPTPGIFSLPEPQPGDKVSESAPSLFVIDTCFDFGLKENSSTSGRYNPANRRNIYNYTQSQRKLAQRAVPATSLSDLRQKVGQQLVSGERSPNSNYIEITHDTLEGQQLRINAKDSTFAAIVLLDMPTHLRQKLMTVLKLSFPGFIKPVESKGQGEKFSFPSLHFSWYNKYCSQGQEAQPNEEPVAYEHRKQATTGKSRLVKTSSTMPYTTSELQDFAEEYIAVSEALAPVFEWLFTALKRLIPSDTEIVGQFAEVLPADGESPAAPFSGFVINFNVATSIHRDNDRGFCVVLIVSENCEGGALCLEELGIKLDLNNGHIVAFPSKKLSHFNTHFKGERVSIVFHTDGSSEGWIKHRNYWKHSLFMLDPGVPFLT